MQGFLLLLIALTIHPARSIRLRLNVRSSSRHLGCLIYHAQAYRPIPEDREYIGFAIHGTSEHPEESPHPQEHYSWKTFPKVRKICQLQPGGLVQVIIFTGEQPFDKLVKNIVLRPNDVTQFNVSATGNNLLAQWVPATSGYWKYFQVICEPVEGTERKGACQREMETTATTMTITVTQGYKYKITVYAGANYTGGYNALSKGPVSKTIISVPLETSSLSFLLTNEWTKLGVVVVLPDKMKSKFDKVYTECEQLHPDGIKRPCRNRRAQCPPQGDEVKEIVCGGVSVLKDGSIYTFTVYTASYNVNSTIRKLNYITAPHTPYTGDITFSSESGSIYGRRAQYVNPHYQLHVKCSPECPYVSIINGGKDCKIHQLDGSKEYRIWVAYEIFYTSSSFSELATLAFKSCQKPSSLKYGELHLVDGSTTNALTTDYNSGSSYKLKCEAGRFITSDKNLYSCFDGKWIYSSTCKPRPVEEVVMYVLIALGSLIILLLITVKVKLYINRKKLTQKRKTSQAPTSRFTTPGPAAGNAQTEFLDHTTYFQQSTIYKPSNHDDYESVRKLPLTPRAANESVYAEIS